MKTLLEWVSKAMRVIGLDSASFREMNKALKWSGVFIVVLLIFAAIFEPPKTADQKLTDTTAREQQSEKQVVKNTSLQSELTKSIRSAFGWVSVICFGLAAFIEPQAPKRDGRFKTGYKGNATVRKKSASEIRLQKGALTTGAITGIVWYLLI